MPSVSQQQQKLFGLSLAFKRGEVPSSEVSDEIKAIADRMSEKDIEDFAATKHKGLPKMKEQLRKIVREIMRERAISELTQSVTEDGKMQGGEDDPCWKGYEMVGMKMKDGKEVPNCVPKNESVNESSKDDDYADELQKETEKVLKGKNIKGWKLYVDSRSGTFEFEKKGIDLLIYATPMWDGNPNLPFNVMDGEGDNVNMIEKLIGNKLPFKPSYDLKKDISNYISVLTKILPKVEQAYGKLKKESVNEAASRTAMEIGGLTGLNKDAVQKFVDSNELDIEKVFQFVKKGKLKDRMDLVSAIAGRTNNPIQKKMITMFKESVNEGASTEEKKIVMMAIKKIAKYRNVSLDYAVGDVIRAAEELERDIQKGKVK